MSSWHSLSSGYLPSWLPLLFSLVKSSLSWLFALSLLLIVNDPCPSSSSFNKFVDTHPLSSSLSSLFVHPQAWLLVLRSAVVLAALQGGPGPLGPPPRYVPGFLFDYPAVFFPMQIIRENTCFSRSSCLVVKNEYTLIIWTLRSISTIRKCTVLSQWRWYLK